MPCPLRTAAWRGAAEVAGRASRKEEPTGWSTGEKSRSLRMWERPQRFGPWEVSVVFDHCRQR